MTKKVPINPEKLYKDSFSLAKKIYQDGYHPDILVGVWRGGAVPGIIISEYMKYKGNNHFHAPIKSEAYTGIGEIDEVELWGVDELVKEINKERYRRMLLVDDINDTGKTLGKIKAKIVSKTRETPEVRTAVVYERSDKEHEIKSDYVQEYKENWLVFPHELEGLSEEEVKEKI